MNEMSDQVRGIIFVLLVLVIIGVWSHFYTPPAPPVPKGTQTASQQAGSTQPVATRPSMKGVSGPPQAPVKVEAVQASAEKTVVI
jgi:hypothetical protein